MDLVGQMYKLSACFDTPNEYKGLPYDYFPEDAVTYGSTVCSFGLSYNDHNYGMPTGLTPPAMAPHLMDPVPKPKKQSSNLLLPAIKSETTSDPHCITIKTSALSPASSTTTTYRSSDSTPRKAYLDENDYPVYVEPEIKVVEVPDNLCVSASEYSDASNSEDSGDDTRVNPEFLFYLRSLASRHVSIERYLEKAHRHYEQYAPSPKSSVLSEKRDNDINIDCICEYNYDDRRMVQCESCGIYQHIDCMYTNPRQVPNILKHKCHHCSDIKVDVSRAKAFQNSRKNWHLSAQYSEKIHQRTKNKSDDQKKHRDTNKSHDPKSELLLPEGGTCATGNTNSHRVNKRKQDLKAYCGVETDKNEENIKQIVEGDSVEEKTTEVSAELPVDTVAVSQKETHGDRHISTDDPNVFLSDMYAQELSQQSEDIDGDDNVKPAASTAMFSSIGEDYTERLAMLNRRPQSFKKDYKEASKSLYTDRLLDKIKEMLEEGEEERKLLVNSFEGLDQGPEFLERNPRCRIVLFDGCTIGLEASVRLQSGSIVCALIGRMMLMEEYMKYTNPTTEHKPFVFLYHNFAGHGLVIDTSVYGNIVRYLRRSCDPNVKLEHTLISGNLYIVVRTTVDICQGVELTIPFDLPFEICQYPVQCACGKVRCPAVKHRRKHHRNRIITTSINCEQVIEDKLRELSQPLCGPPSSYSNQAKKPSLINRYSTYQSRNISDFTAADQLDIKPSAAALQRLSSLTSKARQSAITISEEEEKIIKVEEMEPTPIFEAQSSPLSSPSKKISSDLSGSAILTTKRKHKPVLHPDFETDSSPRVSERLCGASSGRGGRSSHSSTPIKAKPEPCNKRVRTNSGGVLLKQSLSSSSQKINNKETAQDFKSIITTRRQKLHSKKAKAEPTVTVDSDCNTEEAVLPKESPQRRRNRTIK